jgi:DNA-binding transcriptional regulator YiaG
MTPILLRAAIMATTQSARAFASLIGSDERTVRRWLAGDRELPGPVVTLCRLLIERPSLLRLLRRFRERV